MFRKVLALWDRKAPFESALFHAVAQKNPHLQIVTDLLEAGFSVHWGTESQPYTPFQIALLNNTDSRTAQLLLDHGAVLGGSTYKASLLMKAVLEQRSFDKFVLLIKLSVSADPKTLGRVVKGESRKDMSTTSLRDLYSKALSDLGLADTIGPSVQRKTEHSITPTSQHRLLDGAVDEAACSTSQPEARSGENGLSAISADNTLVRAQFSEPGSPCFLRADPKVWEYHIGQTWEQVYGEGRLAAIRGWLESEKNLQEEYSHFTDLDAPGPSGATLLMMTCAQSKPVFVANILYILGMDRVKGAIHRYDNNDMTAVHYAAAVGDVEALKVLLFPGNLLKRAVNIWRLQDELYRSRRLPSRPKGFKGEYLVSDLVPNLDGPPQPWLDIFQELPEETRDRIELPNITFSEWQLTESENCLMPEKLKSTEESRTPLHEAASHGQLAAVKFLLEYSGIDAEVRDVHGKTAADIALEGDYYDIHNLITTHMRGQ
ncbi:ankyrin [Fusarium pseudoanthophilum]|uniref:Ankyrin n=1 Tax=Fusarium pseudoanthophilum TaxID=48495 RepID=A0A8H5KTK8_9HYPO|nr:ankyrin [Fusarium pseudoanthophilum]